MKRVLVTGASGFVGRHAVVPLGEAGFEVHAVSSCAQPAGPECRWHRCNLHEQDSAASLMEEVRPSHLLHLAWYVEPGAYWSSPENLRWVETSLRLARAFAASGGERVVLAGTSAQYDWTTEQNTIGEHGATAPTTLYGASKHALEEILMAWAPAAGVSAACGRLFSLFGPHEHPARLVPSVVVPLLAGRTASVTAGTQFRDYLGVEEAGAAFAALLAETSVTGPVNIASGEGMAVRDLVTLLAEAVGETDLVRFGSLGPRAAEPQRLVADVRRLRDDVGFSPERTIAEALTDTVGWWREQALSR